jgi:hypothetical protein
MCKMHASACEVSVNLYKIFGTQVSPLLLKWERIISNTAGQLTLHLALSLGGLHDYTAAVKSSNLQQGMLFVCYKLVDFLSLPQM